MLCILLQFASMVILAAKELALTIAILSLN
jgi:hypothetical protein